ncbi:MAG: hypothetical protein H0W74_04300 [Sphingosinicella sp.]|nr:hypothetical protein [Sphingosinicella sp.]
MHDLRQYEVVERIKKEGWTKAVLRDLERALAPAFAVGRMSLSSPIPPSGDWSTLNVRHLAEIKVTVSRWADGLDPPAETLPIVVELGV